MDNNVLSKENVMKVFAEAKRRLQEPHDIIKDQAEREATAKYIREKYLLSKSGHEATSNKRL